MTFDEIVSAYIRDHRDDAQAEMPGDNCLERSATIGMSGGRAGDRFAITSSSPSHAERACSAHAACPMPSNRIGINE
jgi:hypothetical protein